MLGPADETVGVTFSDDLLQAARDKTRKVITEAASQIHPGMAEEQAKSLIAEIQTRLGAERTWHAPQIRFGPNTILPFGVPGSRDVVLRENDIFFFDIGPVFAGHEGDVGRSFAVGNNKEHHRCCQDAEAIWHEVREHWAREHATGAALYAFAEAAAQRRGWQLNLQKANGHRIADFPPAARQRGSIQGFAGTPAPNRWILEIQIRHPHEPFGAFYEDLLA